ncbi:MAG: RelA/SpoT family protein [Anaerolineales bacterium]
MKSTENIQTIEQLLAILPPSYTEADRELILRAYRVAEEAHRQQKRASGEPYITHCLAVAGILAELRVPAEVVAAGLLHDTVEDTYVTLDDLCRDFGETIAHLVDGVTKMSTLPRVSREETPIRNGEEPSQEQNAETEVSPSLGRKPDLVAETLRKTLMFIGEDVRVVLIKLADRLHNMRTLSYMPEEKRRRIAQQTLDIFAPLANRLGIWQIKWELEDLSFRYVEPEKYREIAEKLAYRREDRQAEIEQIIARLKKVLEEHGIQAEISGRPKHIYSIYRKMIEKGKTFEEIQDVRGVRLIVPDVATCYAALGVIHTHWHPIPKEFDDYIAAPKENMYQSLHTAVIWEDGRSLEVQIRTPEMHQKAEYGIAAHWRYKEGSTRDIEFEKHVAWLRRMMDWKQEVTDAQEFVETIKNDVFRERVYVLTPKGDIIDLPAGSTPIDFAYHIHTDIGHRCRGARVNGKLVPLNYQLKNGDRVEILTTKRGGPSRDWLNEALGYVKTSRAKSKIRLWFKKLDYQQNLAQGRAILEREIHRLGLRELNFENLAREIGYKNPDDFFVALGCGDLTLHRVIKHISEIKAEAEIFPTPSPSSSGRNGFHVVGLKGILTNIAHCCNPTMGDQIIGYITRGRGVSVHRQDCPNILRARERERERLIRVEWGNPDQERRYSVPIRIKAYDRHGLMSEISTLIAQEAANILSVNVNVSENNLANFFLVMEVRDLNHLSRILHRIEAIDNVLEAYRDGGSKGDTSQ